MSLKDEYFAKMASQFKRWDAQFGMLADEDGLAGTAPNAQYVEQLRAMRANRDATYKQLQEILTASESAWRGMQSVVDTAWLSMKIALDQAARSRTKP